MSGEASQTEAATFPHGFSRYTDWKWPMVPARKLVALNYGRALKADTRRPGLVPVFGTNGQCGLHDAPLAKGPGLILGRKGQGPLGVEWCDKDFWVIDTAYYASTLTPDVELKYLFHLVKYVGLNHLKDGTSNPTLSRDTFGSQLFPLPPIAVQKAIVRILGALDDKIELNRRMNATLESIARALFQSWFVDFDPVRAKLDGRPPTGMDKATADLFPDSFEESSLGCIPKGWKAVPLPEAVEVNPRRTLKSGSIAPYLDMKNLPTRGHSAEEVVERVFSSGTKFQNGDTLLARITPCLENGKTGYVDFLKEDQVGWGSTEYIVFTPKPPLPPQYGYLLARSDALRTHAIQNMTGTSGRQRVPSDCFEKFPLALPTPAIARRFDELTAPLMGKIKNNSTESRTLATLRDTLLPKLLSGELTVDHVSAIGSEVL
jgi:type I restriction enzyme S subunit